MSFRGHKENRQSGSRGNFIDLCFCFKILFYTVYIGQLEEMDSKKTSSVFIHFIS